MLHNLDSDSSKIIEAVRSTGVVITEAMRLYVDYIVSNMKAIGTWDLCNAVYGFVGGTAASHKFNWKDLRDVDAAFRLVYSGAITHSATGVLGQSCFINTFLNPSLVLNQFSTNISTYFHSSQENVTSTIFAGANDAINGRFFYLKNSASVANRTKIFLSSNTGTQQGANMVNPPLNALLGFVSGNLKDNVATLWNKGIKLSTTLAGVAPNIQPNLPVYLFAQNQLGTGASAFDSKLVNFTSIGAGLTDTQAEQQSQIVTNAQLILNRA